MNGRHVCPVPQGRAGDVWVCRDCGAGWRCEAAPGGTAWTAAGTGGDPEDRVRL